LARRPAGAEAFPVLVMLTRLSRPCSRLSRRDAVLLRNCAVFPTQPG
jgi:hypothetical protein